MRVSELGATANTVDTRRVRSVVESAERIRDRTIISHSRLSSLRSYGLPHG
jgi:hypothetical protein